MSLAIRNTDIIDSMGGRKLVLAESGEINYGDAQSIKTVETILEREYESGGYLVLSDFGFATPNRVNGTRSYWESGLWLGRDDFFNDEYLLDNYFVDNTKKKFPFDITGNVYSNPFTFREKLYMYINKGLAYCLNEDTDDWEVSELPYPSSIHGSGALPWYYIEKDDKLYCMEYYSNTLYIHIYDPDTNSWTSTDRLMTLYNGGSANLVLYNDNFIFSLMHILVVVPLHIHPIDIMYGTKKMD